MKDRVFDLDLEGVSIVNPDFYHRGVGLPYNIYTISRGADMLWGRDYLQKTGAWGRSLGSHDNRY